MAEDEDERHKREESDRRAKRKAAKSARDLSEKDRKRREHNQRVLNQVNHHSRHRSSSGQQQPTSSSSERKDHHRSSSSRRHQDPSKPNDTKTTIPSSAPSSSSSIPDSSIFSSLFQQRAQGFRMDFAFRNAPPRPPVGPCFVGRGLDGQLQELANYRPHNAVEVNHMWKLHAEADLGVPLAPSAMNLRMYDKQPSITTTTATTTTTLHPDDEALLQWKGHLGDSAMELLQKAKDTKRATARLALAGKTVPDIFSTAPNFTKKTKKGGDKKKEFSRVLDHGMVFFMKKTTYLSNDHTRKVHDFKSLAETKKRVAEDLSTQQRQFDRSPRTIERSFEKTTTKSSLVHPSGDTTKKVVWEAPLLPNVEYWGHTFTHVVMDSIPPKLQTTDDLEYAYIAHVEQSTMNSKMSCQLLLPQNKEINDSTKDDLTSHDYLSTAQYDLDVVPLKDNDNVANTHYCIWISSDNHDSTNITATYMPIPSRVHLSTVRSGTKKNTITNIRKRNVVVDNDWDEDYYQRMAQVDYDVSTRQTKITKGGGGHVKEEMATSNKMTRFGMLDDNDDEDDNDEEDYDDAKHKNRKPTLDDNDDDDDDDDDDE